MGSEIRSVGKGRRKNRKQHNQKQGNKRRNYMNHQYSARLIHTEGIHYMHTNTIRNLSHTTTSNITRQRRDTDENKQYQATVNAGAYRHCTVINITLTSPNPHTLTHVLPRENTDKDGQGDSQTKETHCDTCSSIKPSRARCWARRYTQAGPHVAATAPCWG